MYNALFVDTWENYGKKGLNLLHMFLIILFPLPIYYLAAGAEWNKLLDKSKWEKMAAQDKTRYEREMQIYKRWSRFTFFQ